MKKNFFPLVCFFLTVDLNAQNINSARIQKVKQAVVRIIINNKPAGTGFFVTAQGNILTCWHVVQPAFYRESVTQKIRTLPIHAELSDGKLLEIGPINAMFSTKNIPARAYDYCILGPMKLSQNNRYSFLKLGSFSDVLEGDVILYNGISARN